MSATKRKTAAVTASTQLRRLLHVIPRLADGEEHSIADIARLAEATPEALFADLRALVERYDTPAGWVDGIGIFLETDRVSVRSDHFLRPMRLTMPELCALELGLRMAARERGAAGKGAVQGALARLGAAITRLDANERHEELRAAVAVDAAVLETVRGALRDRRKVRITYRAGSADAASERVVCPYGTAFASGAWYVIAHCERSEGLRFFRHDRIARAERLEQGFERPESFRLEEVLPRGRAFATDEADAMTVCYSPRIARWIAEREGRGLAADGSLTLDHPVADEEWAIRHVLQYGPDAEVLAPVELRRRIVERLSSVRMDGDRPAAPTP